MLGIVEVRYLAHEPSNKRFRIIPVRLAFTGTKNLPRTDVAR